MRRTLERIVKSARNRAAVNGQRIRGAARRLALLPIARCGPRLSVGHGVRIEVYGSLDIGSDVRLEDGCHLCVAPGAKLRLGNGVFVGRFTTVAAISEIEIGDHTLIAEHASIRDSDHPLDAIQRRADLQGPSEPLFIGRDVWIGAGARVLRGARLGDGTVVGANSVVVRPFPGDQLLVGAPARAIRTLSSATRS